MRRVIRLACWLLLFAMATCCLPSCEPTHDSSFTNVNLLTAERGDLRKTTITPVLTEPIAEGRNVVWCGTFQLAWNEVRTLIGEDLHFLDEPSLVGALNAGKFSRENLDDDSYIALAGFVRDGIFDKIKAALQAKFQGAASPHCLPAPWLTPWPQDIVAYSYLFKHLQFPIPFERVDAGMLFMGKRVEAFGLPTDKPDYVQRYGNVLIHDYRSGDDFVIELKTKAEGDQLVLAKVTPGATLGATVAAVEKRLDANSPQTMTKGDVLLAPKMNFDLTAEYAEFYDRPFRVKNPAVDSNLVIVSAMQNIRFQIDEKGVTLRSEANLGFSKQAMALPRHILIFDKPYLLMMQRRGASQPYFALWVADVEILESKDR